MRKKVATALFLFFLTTTPVYAQQFLPTTDWGTSGCLQNGDVATLECIPIVMRNIINSLIALAAVVCVFLIIFAGYKFVMSEGDPEKITSARKTFIYALAGFGLVLVSFTLLTLISQFTGVESISGKPR